VKGTVNLKEYIYILSLRPEIKKMKKKFNLVSYLSEERDKGIIIWICNIGAEKYWNKVNTGMSDKYEDAIVNRIEEMNLLICRKQDIMILREKPDDSYLDTLKEIGFDIPNIFIPENADHMTPISELVLKDEKLQSQLLEISKNNSEVYFVPYAITYLEEQIAKRCSLNLIGASSQINAKINDKIFCREIAEKLKFPVCQGNVCESIEEIRKEYCKLTESEPFFKKIIIKEPFGASGKGLYIIENKTMLEPILRIISRFAKNNSNAKWLVEGWYEKKADINYQIYVSENGSVSVFSIKQQLLNNTIYIGSKIPPDLTIKDIQSYKNCGEEIGKYLYSLGYTGIAGIDSLITMDGTIIPIIEINGRFTLSTYISFLDKITDGNMVITRYFSISTKSCLSYHEIQRLLKEKGINFNIQNKEGIIVYTSGTFTGGIKDVNCNYLGRIFALIIGETEQKIEGYINSLENLVKQII
jgi:hypothetical protein